MNTHISPLKMGIGLDWGLTAGKTMLLCSGDGLDLSVGFYDLTEVPELGSNWQFKFGISYFFN